MIALKKHQFRDLDLTINIIPEIIITNAGEVTSYSEFASNFFVPEKIQGITQKVMKRLIREAKREEERVAGKCIYLFTKKPFGLNVVYMHKAQDEPIYHNFVRGHEEMHAFSFAVLCILTPHISVQENLNTLYLKYPRLASKIIDLYDSEQREVIADCGGYIYNQNRGYSPEQVFRAVLKRYEESKKLKSKDRPIMINSLECALQLIS